MSYAYKRAGARDDDVVKTGRKTWKRGITTENRKEEVAALFAQLKTWMEEVDPSLIAEAEARYGDGYHGKNPMMIAMGDPLATDVDAFKAWQERGRTPVGPKGKLRKTHGIRIIAPGRRWYEQDPADPSKKIMHVADYHITYVYDVRHTIPTVDADEIRAWQEAHPDGWETGENS